MNRSHPLAEFSVGSFQCSVKGSICRRPSVLHPRCSGFTLIELMVVVAIIAVLAGLTLGTLGYVNRKGAESRARSEVATIAAAIDNYKLEFGSYPSTNTTELFRELTGRGKLNTTKVFIEPTPGLVTNTTNGPFIDPWGTAYQYSTNPKTIRNVGFFDLWTSNNAPTLPAEWIRN
jgi:type II secretion system protein G